MRLQETGRVTPTDSVPHTSGRQASRALGCGRVWRAAALSPLNLLRAVDRGRPAVGARPYGGSDEKRGPADC
jgi:hypothetical protein